MRGPERTIRIVCEPDGSTVRAKLGVSLYEAAVGAGGMTRFECGGQGKCGKCRMIVKDQGLLSEITIHEREHLSPSELGEGYRLACQARAYGDVVAFIPPESRVERRKLQVTGYEVPTALDPLVEITNFVRTKLAQN